MGALPTSDGHTKAETTTKEYNRHVPIDDDSKMLEEHAYYADGIYSSAESTRAGGLISGSNKYLTNVHSSKLVSPRTTSLSRSGSQWPGDNLNQEKVMQKLLI